MSKLLVTDIGNTNIVLSVYSNGLWQPAERVKTKDSNTINNFKDKLKTIDFDCAVVSSVVPHLTQRICQTIEEFKVYPLIVDRKLKTGLITELIPEELGSDILCNLINAHYSYPNDYVTIADFGTAFTTATVSPEGKFLGVTISPGMMTSVKALFQNTAQLPEIKLDLPNTVLGKNTIDSIRAGVLYGFVGQVESIVSQIEKEIEHKVKLVLTGGLSKYVKPYISRVEKSDIMFTIDGARLFYELNTNDR